MNPNPKPNPNSETEPEPDTEHVEDESEGETPNHGIEEFLSFYTEEISYAVLGSILFESHGEDDEKEGVDEGGGEPPHDPGRLLPLPDGEVDNIVTKKIKEIMQNVAD